MKKIRGRKRSSKQDPIAYQIWHDGCLKSAIRDEDHEKINAIFQEHQEKECDGYIKHHRDGTLHQGNPYIHPRGALME